MLGLLGGVIVFHPYRQNDDLTWRFGPHFHIIANGWVNRYKVPPGWVEVGIREVKPTRNDFYCLAYYMCSHAGVGDGVGHVVNWFGNCSGNSRNGKALIVEDAYRYPKECKTCQGGLYRISDWIRYRRGWVDFVPSIQETNRLRAWCIRSDLDDVRRDYAGKSALEISEAHDPRIYIEVPASLELTDENIRSIDSMFDQDRAKERPRPPSETVSEDVPLVVVPFLPRPIVSEGPPPGGSEGPPAGAVVHV